MASKAAIKSRKQQIVELYPKKACNVSAVCASVGISRRTFYDYVKEDEEFARSIDESKQALIDNAESILQKKIMAEDTTALIFFLKTIGKSRGYVEKQEVEHEGLSQLVISHVTAKEPKVNGE